MNIFKNGYIEQLIQLMQVTWDGDLICKDHRNELVKCEYATRYKGCNAITEKGFTVLVDLGIIRF